MDTKKTKNTNIVQLNPAFITAPKNLNAVEQNNTKKNIKNKNTKNKEEKIIKTQETKPLAQEINPSSAAAASRIKRKRKRNPAPDQNPTSPTQKTTGIKKASATIQKRKYEIDNSNLPKDMPPVQPLEQYGVDLQNNIINKTIEQNSVPKTLKNKNNTVRSQNIIKPEKISNIKSNIFKPEAIKISNIAKIITKNKLEVEDNINLILHENTVPMLREELWERFDLPNGETNATINNMLKSGQLYISKKMRIALPSQVGHVVGKLQTTSRGFGFLLPEDTTEDVFLPANALSGAMNGDRVVVKTVASHGSSREGAVIAILERANTSVVGSIEKLPDGSFYINPDNVRIGAKIRIAKGKLGGAKEGQKVVGTIVYFEDKISVKITEILGDADEVGVDVLSIVKSYGFSEVFDKTVILAANAVPDTVQTSDMALREDLRQKQIVTIDGADAKDFDDAISCEKLNDGTFLLGVHIADVSHYVEAGKILDKEAFERSTSVYFVDRVIPMLPEKLSNGICSLNPHLDRLTLSCHMQINSSGQVINHRISESVINSKHRLIYENVTAALEGDIAEQKNHQEIMPMLKNMQELSKVLNLRRETRGSIDFDFPEAKIILDKQGHTIAVETKFGGLANKMIEEFMLICNETIAQHMNALKLPMIYRVHETPDSEKIDNFKKFLGGFGLFLKENKEFEVTPKALQVVLKQAQDKPEEKSVSKIMLRSLKKARYCEENLGHFGLAAQYYCHFTSPIRRYPDLIVHRILKQVLSGKLDEKKADDLRKLMPEIAKHTSLKERSAMEAERDVDDLKKCEFMATRIGQELDGTVSGVTANGLFVELQDTCEGFLHITALKDDYYIYQETKYRLIGRSTSKIISLGDPIKIKVVSADISARRVEFGVA